MASLGGPKRTPSSGSVARSRRSPPREREEAIGIVNEADVSALIRRDPLFAEIRKSYGNPPDWRRRPGFESLLRIILEQQISLDAALAHYRRLKTYVGGISCSALLRLSDAEYRECQISRQKTLYLRELAAAVKGRSLSLPRLADLGPEEVRAELTRIKGIGDWTADIYLMFCLQSKDIFPLGDIAIRRAAEELTGASGAEELLERAERWRPLRSLATYFLWHYYLSTRKKLFPFDARA